MTNGHNNICFMSSLNKQRLREIKEMALTMEQSLKIFEEAMDKDPELKNTKSYFSIKKHFQEQVIELADEAYNYEDGLVHQKMQELLQPKPDSRKGILEPYEERLIFGQTYDQWNQKHGESSSSASSSSTRRFTSSSSPFK